MLQCAPDFVVARVCSRRLPESIDGIEAELVTSSIDQMVESCEVVVEASGDVNRAAEVVQVAHQAGKPVVTMGTEFHVTVGSAFCRTGYLTEAEGDQPGSLAALALDAREMGFEPLVYGNIKGYLEHLPEPKEMEKWSRRNGISVEQTVSFTDGTKLQMEQALVANGMGATVHRRGLEGPQVDDLKVAADHLAQLAQQAGSPLSDYVLSQHLPAGVFVVAKHPCAKPEVMRYLKLGQGPFYTLLRPFHLCHLEIPKTLRRVVAGAAPLLNNSTAPEVGVVAIAKQDVAAGGLIERAMGGFQLRGEAAKWRDHPSAVPIGLLNGVRLARPIEKGQILHWEDVELPDTLAVQRARELWQQRMTEASA
ncbi:MAG: NAD(P)-dependent oxidoreductase [Verrucomicrobiales bacterium]|nr:NAD(P)-dependent oxidoreductase [Verrucomicrobiales bacterium]